MAITGNTQVDPCYDVLDPQGELLHNARKRTLSSADESASKRALAILDIDAKKDAPSSPVSDQLKLKDLTHVKRKTIRKSKKRDRLENFSAVIHKSNIIEAIKYAHAKGNINMTNKDGDSLLHLATSFEDLDAVRMCIQFGINVDAYNDQGETALIIATCDGNIEMIQLLLQLGAQNIPYQNTPSRTPSILAYYDQRQFVMEALPLHPDERSTIYEQELAFTFNLENPSEDTPPSCLWSFAHLAKISANPELKLAFQKAANKDRSLYTDLQSDDCSIFEFGTLNHAITLVVGKLNNEDVLAICNRGFGRNGASIQFFPIDRNLLDEEMLETIEEYRTQSIDDPDVLEYLYKDLPEELSPSDCSIEEDIEILNEILNLKPQKGDNCSLASPKAAAAAIIALQTYQDLSQTHSFEDIQLQTKSRYKKEVGLPLRLHIKNQAIQSGLVIPESTLALIDQKIKKYT